MTRARIASVALALGCTAVSALLAGCGQSATPSPAQIAGQPAAAAVEAPMDSPAALRPCEVAAGAVGVQGATTSVLDARIGDNIDTKMSDPQGLITVKATACALHLPDARLIRIRQGSSPDAHLVYKQIVAATAIDRNVPGEAQWQPDGTTLWLLRGDRLLSIQIQDDGQGGEQELTEKIALALLAEKPA